MSIVEPKPRCAHLKINRVLRIKFSSPITLTWEHLLIWSCYILTSTAQLLVWSLLRKLSKDFSAFAGASWQNKVTTKPKSSNLAAILVSRTPQGILGISSSKGVGNYDDVSRSQSRSSKNVSLHISNVVTYVTSNIYCIAKKSRSHPLIWTTLQVLQMEIFPINFVCELCLRRSFPNNDNW